MKKYILLATAILSSSIYATEVKCYSGGHMFYHKKIKDLYIGDGFIVNRDNGYNEIVTADCLIRFKK